MFIDVIADPASQGQRLAPTLKRFLRETISLLALDNTKFGFIQLTVYPHGHNLVSEGIRPEGSPGAPIAGVIHEKTPVGHPQRSFQMFVLSDSLIVMLTALAHEMVHVRQMVDGRLARHDLNGRVTCFWEGEPHAGEKSIGTHAEYAALPWEREANDLMGGVLTAGLQPLLRDDESYQMLVDDVGKTHCGREARVLRMVLESASSPSSTMALEEPDKFREILRELGRES